METNFIAEIISSILAISVPVGTFASIFLLIRHMNLKIFKVLLDNYKTDQPKPASMVRIPHFRVGQGVGQNNALSIAENSGQLYLKALMVPLMMIPMSDIKSVDIREGYFGRKSFILEFKKNELPKLHFDIRESQLSELKALISLASKDAKKEFGIPSKAIPKNTQNLAMSNQTIGQIKSSGSNALRIIAFIVAIVCAIIVIQQIM